MRRDDSLPVPLESSSSTGSRMRSFAGVAKLKTKKVLRIESSNDNNDAQTQHEVAMKGIIESPTFNSSRFLNKESTSIHDKAKAFMQATKQAIAHPTSAMKTRATQQTWGKLAKSRPYLSKKADLDFLGTHEDSEDAEVSMGARGDKEATKARSNGIDQCESDIESMRVAWVATRHIQRARAVDLTHVPFPDIEHFEQPDDCGVPEFQLGKYITLKLLHSSHSFTAQYIDDFDELPYDSDSVRSLVERLIIVSAPLRTFLLDARSVYTWKDPARTGRWLMLYMFLWYTSHIVTFMWTSAIYTCLMNYLYPSRLEELRDDFKRSLDRGATALEVGELMDMHGSDDWLESLLDKLGPYIQVQINDLTNLLEIIYNFFHWCDPSATRNTLCLNVAFLLLAAFGGSYFNLRLFWLSAGFCFFACWPISSLYPRYRLLVSPFRIAFWDVPTHAEWCFRYLHNRASIARQEILSSRDEVSRGTGYTPNKEAGPDFEESSDTANDGTLGQGRDVLNFSCTYLNTSGRFIVSTSGLRFEGALGSRSTQNSFNKSYAELVEISKLQGGTSMLSPLSKFTGMDQMELRFRGGIDLHAMGDTESPQVVLLENMRCRDKAFNAIVGFSGLRWQCLQKRPDRDKKPTK